MGSLPQLSILKGPSKSFVPGELHKIFEAKVDQGCGNKTAIIFNDSSNEAASRTINYNTLNSTANRIAAQIVHNVRQINDRKPNQDNDWVVAVCMSPSDNLITTLLSIWKAGAAYMPLDPTFPANRIEHILNESKPVLVIHDNELDSEAFLSVPTISFAQLTKDSMNFSNANLHSDNTLNADDDPLAIILYTSGSTGIPKGVRLPHSIIMNRLLWQWDEFPYSKTETVGVFKTALTFVDHVSEIWGPLLNEMSVLCVPKIITKNPEKLVALLENYKIERLVLVPTLLKSILMYLSLKNQPKLLYDLKIWVCSGESLSISLAREFFDYFLDGHHCLCNFYGSTEVMGDVTFFTCESKKQLESLDKVPIGYPINNTILYLLDNDYRPVKLGAVGELYVSGLNLADGYVNGRDKERFIENPLAVDPKYSRLYKTGDFASVSKNAVIYEGRTDSQIKIRGYRVDLAEVEKHLLSIQGIDKGIVLCYNAGEINQALLAFVTITTDSLLKTGIQIEAAMQKVLPLYMVPQVIIVDTIPLLVNGKVDRQSLLKQYENSNNNDDNIITTDYDYTEVPQSQIDVANDLFRIVGNVIGRSTRTAISLNSNFYELGGNSLNSIFTVTQLREQGYFISITQFISAKNLGEILNIISNVNVDQISSTNLLSDIDNEFQAQLTSKPLTHDHKNDVIEIITSSFYEKADLEQWLKPDIMRTDYADILNAIWNELVKKELSFILTDANDRTVGVALNFDARDEPEVIVTSKLALVFEFLEFVEGPIRDNQLPSGLNKILHSFMMGTNAELNAPENITVMQFMENEVLNLAKRRQFLGILTTNTNPLTQQLGGSVYGYKTMLDYQVNQYIHSNGTRPFEKAPDSQRAVVHWKCLGGDV